MKLIILLAVISSSIIPQDDAIAKLFPGKWKMITDKQEYYEQWDIVNESELTGSGFNIEEGDTVISERFYLKKFDNVWAYVAIPVNQPITLFALSGYSESKFIFENGEHDFPQRIIYEFASDTELKAAIEGVIDGELMRREFNFVRVEN